MITTQGQIKAPANWFQGGGYLLSIIYSFIFEFDPAKNEEVNYLIFNPISFLTNLCAPVACAPVLSLAIFVEKKHPLVSVESLLHKKNEEVNGKVYC